MSKWTQKYYQKLKAIVQEEIRCCWLFIYGVSSAWYVYSRVWQGHRLPEQIYTDGFQQTEHCTNGIDGNYVDGVSITHGYHPRKHILLLLFLKAVHYLHVCSCTNNQISPSLLQPVLSFVGNEYFCYIGSTTTSVTRSPVGWSRMWVS